MYILRNEGESKNPQIDKHGPKIITKSTWILQPKYEEVS
jgi:hypothetical protein